MQMDLLPFLYLTYHPGAKEHTLRSMCGSTEYEFSMNSVNLLQRVLSMFKMTTS